ncbi:MAG: diaminopimelate epimerase [Ferrovum sp. 37-45-19]|uniref:diaminopimelate epimerase n=1 Tax=Ferrovum sp. JA12 TaxID=1356299 RepID=UPI000703975D|nr:diaminopimelate epimerase [Ferrovum sp. JA12]OYV79706.1 MAG: diaminopimelate epimerase [Ferrovum sp. 21-44-67]OYV94312.1 MAG: diaminopimelate epimerase [Ferrovum sp. 37-45-19]OZB32386.1 MAG: diaminopimelate epimerase [Ferrovum sp. 34-44-207]HQT80566.1 diaminopimelate epimerase [Ferrovaceae bacterium]KRH79655.1 diaminopimelate epimerase [Ferrovum sp. JA12]
MQFQFTKMQGSGNDFIVINAIDQPINLSVQDCQWLADRHFGVGCDQILLVEKPHHSDHDFRYRILNADGSEVENCGNGARCFARFVVDQQLTTKHQLLVETAGGVISPQLLADGRVCVNMGVPQFNPVAIPFVASQEQLLYSLQVGELDREIAALSMGNPHAVQIVSDINNAPVASEGPLIEHHERFPQRVNAGFMQILDRGHIQLRVYERGAGETLACGTGACAAVVSGIRQHLLDQRVTVFTRGGELTIEWAGGISPVLMTGDAITVFEGSVMLPKHTR